MKYIHFVLASIFVASTLAAPTIVHRSSLQTRGSDEVYERRDLQLLRARAKDGAGDKAGDKAKAEGKKSARKKSTDFVRGALGRKSKQNLKEDPHSEETPLIPPVPAVPEPAGKQLTKHAGGSQAGGSRAPGPSDKTSLTTGSSNRVQRPGGSQAPGPSDNASPSSSNRVQRPASGSQLSQPAVKQPTKAGGSRAGGSRAPGPSDKTSLTTGSSNRVQGPGGSHSQRPGSAGSRAGSRSTRELFIDTTLLDTYGSNPQPGISPAFPTSSTPRKSSLPISSPPPDPKRRPSEQFLLPGNTPEEQRKKRVMHNEKTLGTNLRDAGI